MKTGVLVAIFNVEKFVVMDAITNDIRAIYRIWLFFKCPAQKETSKKNISRRLVPWNQSWVILAVSSLPPFFRSFLDRLRFDFGKVYELLILARMVQHRPL